MEPDRPEWNVNSGPDHRGRDDAMGDDSFADFYSASYQRLLGQLFAVTGDLAEAENLLQEAYARTFAPLGAGACLRPPRGVGAAGGVEPGRRGRQAVATPGRGA